MGLMDVTTGADTHALDALRAALPGDTVVSEPDALEKYRHDWSRDARQC